MISLSGSCISADQLLELLWGTSNINNKHCEKDSNPESDQNKEMEDIETREKSDYCNQQGMYAENRPTKQINEYLLLFNKLHWHVGLLHVGE